MLWPDARETQDGAGWAGFRALRSDGPQLSADFGRTSAAASLSGVAWIRALGAGSLGHSSLPLGSTLPTLLRRLINK